MAKQQKFILPQEFEVWHILPAIRKKLALALIAKGLSQKEVAKLMQTSEASISHYKKDKRAKDDILESSIDRDIEQAVAQILENKHSLMSQIVRLNSIIKEKGILCEKYLEQVAEHGEKVPCISCKDVPVKICFDYAKSSSSIVPNE